MKVKWEVAPAPTGRYKSFQWRGWPHGVSDCGMFFGIRCEDDYYPKHVKEGNHKPLKLTFRDDSKQSSAVRMFKKEFSTLAELKEFVSKLDVSSVRKEKP